MQSRSKDNMNSDLPGRERRSRIAERGDSSLRSVYNDSLSGFRDHFETTPSSMRLECSGSRVVSAVGLVLVPIGMSCQDLTHPCRIYAMHLSYLKPDWCMELSSPKCGIRAAHKKHVVVEAGH